MTVVIAMFFVMRASYPSTVLAVIVCLSVRLSVRPSVYPSQVGVVQRWLKYQRNSNDLTSNWGAK